MHVLNTPSYIPRKKTVLRREKTHSHKIVYPPPTHTEPRRPVYEMIYDSKIVSSYIDETNPLPLNLGFLQNINIHSFEEN